MTINVGQLAATSAVAGAIGLLFVGYTATKQRQQGNIDMLPAMQLQVQSNKDGLLRVDGALATTNAEINEIQRSIASNLDRDSLDGSFEALDKSIAALEEQLNRRITFEVKEPLYATIDTLAAQVVDINRILQNRTDESLNRINKTLESISRELSQNGNKD